MPRRSSRHRLPIAILAGGFAPSGGEALIFNYAWSPYTYQNLNNYAEWDEVQGTDDIRYSANGEFYPQGVSYHRWITPQALPDDQFLEFTCTNSWVTSGDYMGAMLRGHTSQKSGYSFHVGDEGRILSRWDDNVETVLDSDATLPVTGDVYELRAVGTTISVLKDSVPLFSEVDATYSSGWAGLVSKGLDSNAEIEHILAGPMPSGNAIKHQQQIGDPTRGVGIPVVDGCLTVGGVDNANDTSTTSTSAHSAAPHDVGGTNMHWLEWDCLQPCYTTGIQMYDHLSHHASRQWDDISVFGRADPGDAWAQIAANLDCSDAPNFGWLPAQSWPGGGVAYRYYRVEIYSSLDASDHVGVNEIVLLGDMG